MTFLIFHIILKTSTIEEFLRLKKPKYSSEEKSKKLEELRKKWDYEIDFSDW